MKLIGPSSAFAPMPTGHPLGLPGQMSVKDAQTRVVEPAKSGSTQLATHLGVASQAAHAPNRSKDEDDQPPIEGDDRQAVTPAADLASDPPPPPTILQLKINEILQAQAEAKRVDAIKPTPPEPAPAIPQNDTPAPEAKATAEPARDIAPQPRQSPAPEQQRASTDPATDSAADAEDAATRAAATGAEDGSNASAKTQDQP